MKEERNYLFSMGKGLKEDLDEGIFTEKLSNEFEDNGVLLPKNDLPPYSPRNIHIWKVKEGKWEMVAYPTDKEGLELRFIIEEGAKELNVYEKKENAVTYYAYVYVINIDGGNQTKIAERTFIINQTPSIMKEGTVYGGARTSVSFYSWSPDSTKIVVFDGMFKFASIKS